METGIDYAMVISISAAVIGISLPFLAIINSLALFILHSLKDSDRQQWDRIRKMEEYIYSRKRHDDEPDI